MSSQKPNRKGQTSMDYLLTLVVALIVVIAMFMFVLSVQKKSGEEGNQVVDRAMNTIFGRGSTGSNCGNGKLETGEECDGNQFSGGKPSCIVDFGCTGGEVTCGYDCKVSTKGCIGCLPCDTFYGGQCTPEPPGCVGGWSHEGGGDESCAPDPLDPPKVCCEWAGGSAIVCGNNVLTAPEECEWGLDRVPGGGDDELTGRECDDFAPFTAGELQCSETCTFDTSKCYDCGDGVLATGLETCEVGNPTGSLCDWSNCDQATCQCLETCDDTILNNEETDVDCGGPNCPECADQSDCLIDDDCESNICIYKNPGDSMGVCAEIILAPRNINTEGVYTIDDGQLNMGNDNLRFTGSAEGSLLDCRNVANELKSGGTVTVVVDVNVDGMLIRNCKITATNNGGSALGIRGDDNEVMDSVIEGGRTGVMIDGVDDNYIHDNDISSRDIGVRIMNTAEDNEISGNEIGPTAPASSSFFGVYITDESSGNKIGLNIISTPGSAGPHWSIFLDTSPFTATSNFVNGNTACQGAGTIRIIHDNTVSTSPNTCKVCTAPAGSPVCSTVNPGQCPNTCP
ncbi:MAG: right-handed parallel beta-helix repeat-containing protein [Candidatus Altiarchaeota archaeon]|nr:right-handed parallel beta-helix repeat-containing protein [Candidatus Altiarchaeota archaeon]